MARMARSGGERAGNPSQPPASLSSLPNGLPAGVAWDTEAKGRGPIIPYVEADARRGERCPYCHRKYEGEQADTPPPSLVGLLALLQVLVDAAEHQKIARDLQLGRWVYLIARRLGLLPGCASDAELANYLKIDPALLSHAKERLPPKLQALCELRHRRRKPRSPQLQNSEQSPDSIGDSKRR